MKKVKIQIKKNKKGYYFSIVSANGKNLNPSDIQVRKQSVVRAVKSLIKHISENRITLIDTTNGEN